MVPYADEATTQNLQDLLSQPFGDLLVLLDGYAGTPADTPARYPITSSADVTSA